MTPFRVSRRTGASLMAVAAISCAPRLRPLPGVPSAQAVPRAELPVGHRHIVFRWELEDPDMTSRGDGAARVASPDSVRLDFFLGGGVGSGAAVLIGDTLHLPSRVDDIARKMVPPPPLLWGALGRTRVPSAADTTVRVDGDTLRADIGTPVAWRLTFVRDTLRRIERVGGARVLEWVERSPDGHVRYRQEVNRRQLDLYLTRSDEVSDFDPTIWYLP